MQENDLHNASQSSPELSQAILLCAINSRVLAIHSVLDLYVQVAHIVGIGRTFNFPCYNLAGTDCKRVIEIENCLLPVGVFGVRGGGKDDGFVNLRGVCMFHVIKKS